MIRLDKVVSDRGSRYAVTGGVVAGRAGVDAFLRDLKREKKFAKATHNSWGHLFQMAYRLRGMAKKVERK